MLIQAILTIWLLALIFLTNRFRHEQRIPQQRIFSVFLIIWAILGLIYYDVWSVTSGHLEANAGAWQTYLPAVFFSICAGLGTYYLLQTFGKFRAMAEKNQRQADAQQAAKQKAKQKEKQKQSGASGSKKSGTSKTAANKNSEKKNSAKKK